MKDTLTETKGVGSRVGGREGWGRGHVGGKSQDNGTWTTIKSCCFFFKKRIVTQFHMEHEVIRELTTVTFTWIKYVTVDFTPKSNTQV